MNFVPKNAKMRLALPSGAAREGELEVLHFFKWKKKIVWKKEKKKFERKNKQIFIAENVALHYQKRNPTIFSAHLK